MSRELTRHEEVYIPDVDNALWISVYADRFRDAAAAQGFDTMSSLRFPMPEKPDLVHYTSIGTVWVLARGCGEKGALHRFECQCTDR